MPQRTRALVAAAAAAVLIVLFVALRPGGDDDEPTTSTQAAATTTTATTPTPETATVATTATQAAPPPAPEPEVTRIRVQGLKPVGGVKEIEAEKGDTVRFTVISDKKDHVHLHGYDVQKDVGPGQRATFTFKAKIEGIFEIELEESAVPIAELRVEP